MNTYKLVIAIREPLISHPKICLFSLSILWTDVSLIVLLDQEFADVEYFLILLARCNNIPLP